MKSTAHILFESFQDANYLQLYVGLKKKNIIIDTMFLWALAFDLYFFNSSAKRFDIDVHEYYILYIIGL